MIVDYWPPGYDEKEPYDTMRYRVAVGPQAVKVEGEIMGARFGAQRAATDLMINRVSGWGGSLGRIEAHMPIYVENRDYVEVK